VSAPWHAQQASTVSAELRSDPTTGLDAGEVAKRLEQFGPNRLVTAGGVAWYRVLLRQFHDVLIGILAVAAGVSVAIGEVLDASAILAILVLNGLLGFVQEWRAEQALAALQGMLSRRCKVLRGGAESEIDAEHVVPGDIIVLSGGDRVPADIRILTGQELEVDESALTGESLSVRKAPPPVAADCALAERASMAWMGTVVASGRASGVVVATGMSTEFGRIAELTRSVERDPTPLQRRLGQLGRQLGTFAVAVSSLVAVVGWLLGRPALEMFMTGVSLAVAVVPEGLPAVVTVTLALGVRQMVRRRALPRRLQAAETLGSATILLTDKTGTLTENEMTVSRIWLPRGEVEVSGTGYRPEGSFLASGQVVGVAERADLAALLETGLVCNHASIERKGDGWTRVGEPTEAALIVAARKAGLGASVSSHAAEFPFSSSRKRMTVLLESPEAWLAHAKGAPEVILERCTHVLDGDEEREITPDDRERATAAYRELASSGMRTLALARRRVPRGTVLDAAAVESDFTLLGIAGIMDPARAEVPDAVARAGESGIRVMMITGDAPETALAIAEQIGLLVERAITGPELDVMEDDELLRELERPVLFARTTPEHKLRIARILEDSGQVVGMTGDGVNDAPALKEADIGIAMGIRGTDVAREASDLVLMDDNFASIVNAVEEGRREYDNIRKFTRYLLSSNVGETVAIFLAIVLSGPLILLPVQILWINVVTDAVTAIALGLEPAERELMRRPPRRPDEPILDRAGIRSIVVFGSYIGLATLGLFLFYLHRVSPENLLLAQTMAFTAMVVLEQVNLFNHRALHSPLAAVGFFTNPWLLVALIGTTALHLAAVYVPFMQKVLHTTALGWSDWGLLLLVGAPLFLVPEAMKWLDWRRRQVAAPHGGAAVHA